MASIERTAYPRLKRRPSARELQEAFTPSDGEVEWARGLTRSEERWLAPVVLLKCFQRLDYFPSLAEVPVVVVDHVRQQMKLPDQVAPIHESERSAKRHREWVRERLGVTYDAERARMIAEQAIRAAAAVKDKPADLINVALEELIRARCELPAYSTLDRLAGRIRAEVNGGIFALVPRSASSGTPWRLPRRNTRSERIFPVALRTLHPGSNRRHHVALRPLHGAAKQCL